jgi:hypothetical protein
MSERAAAQRYLDGATGSFTAVLGDGQRPECVIDIAPEGPDFRVNFVDYAGSINLVYHFGRTGDRLFLHRIDFWRYPDDGQWYQFGDQVSDEVFSYQPDGVVRHEFVDRRTARVLRESRENVMVEQNWEPIPDFGDFASIGRRIRHLPII